jgi:thiol-disulfide isomerase/thioredoxin
MTPTRTTDTRRERRAARRAAARTERPSQPGVARWALPALIGAVVVVAALAALMLPGLGGTTGGGSSTLPPASSAAAGSAASAGSSGAIVAPVVTGNPLPDFQNPTADSAVGLPAPLVTGSGFDGKPAAIAANGKPKVVLFLAHWCPHCQATVPVVQAWVNAGGLPSGVDLVSVVTSISSAAPNYPPDAWLAREGWTVPVIVDPDNAVAHAYGLPAFPYWTFIAGDGTIRARLVGELKIADLEASIRGLTGS